MKFLCLSYLDRGLTPGPDVAAQYAALGQDMRAAGVLLNNGQLSPADASKTVRVMDGVAEITDGPARSGAAPLAFFLLECDDVEDAMGWAARIPAASYGSVEVTPQR